MASFLEKLTDELLQKHHGDLSGISLVFPTRRAGLFFKKIYSAKLSKPAWAPSIYAIEDFIQSLSDLQVADQLDLVFELYEVYHRYFPSESFDRFYPWGIMLLKDFEDADSSLARTERLFATISDLKSIDEQFDLAEEDRQRVEEFWKVFFGKEPGEIRKNFLDNWKHLSPIYSEFKSQLQKKNLAYHGLVAKTVADSLKKEEGEIPLPSDHYVFAGFNALTRAEQTIIDYFVKRGIGSVYYDADEYYVDDPKQEAGTFIRKSIKKAGNWKWKETLLSNDEKQIETIGVSLQSLQAKMPGQILSGQNQKFQPETTAIVLPDEQLLIPVLYSLPATIPDLNVTMGYPLHSSPLFALFESLFELQKSFRNNPPSFYFKNVLSVLSHPNLHNLYYEETNKWLESYRQNLEIRISQEELLSSNSKLFQVLFISLEGKPVKEWFNYFETFFSLLIDAIRKNKNGIHSIEKEFVYYFYTRFKKLREVIEKFNQDISVETFRSLFREVIYSTRIPFTGEPLKGIQVMGFLETRVLDFETVIILSVNEGVLPAASHHPSFIPFNLRKAYGLPTHEEQNAIAAYHFYRLLQRAKNIFLIYNTEVKSLSGGEKSRYILQIENELLKKNSKIKYKNHTVNLLLKEQIAPQIAVKKSQKVMDVLSAFNLNPTSISGKQVKYLKKFSASGLIQYITCPLRFYFQHIAGLREQEEAEETIEGGLFGTILHEAMNMLYKTHKVITASDFDKIQQQVEKATDEAISLHFARPDRLEGKNILMRNVLIELVHKIVALDRANAPLNIKYLEKEFAVPLNLNGNASAASPLLYGIIDRIDLASDSSGSFLRIVDYKTGKRDMKNAHQDIELLFSSPDYKEQFQTFFYSWLLHKQLKDTGDASILQTHNSIKAGLFRLREISQGISYINDGQNITDEQFALFEQHLKHLLNEIFNPEVAFNQTEDEKRCTYCAFKDICNR